MLNRTIITLAGALFASGLTSSQAVASPGEAHHTVAHPAQDTPAGFQAKEGSLVHLASGMEFPLQVGEAALVGERTYDAQGDYVALRYRIPLSDGTDASVQIGMVDMPGMTARQHYDSRRPLALAKLPDAQLLAEEPFPGLNFDNFYGRFTDGSKVEGLITAQFGSWGVRAETEYARGAADEAHQRIADFLAQLDWKPMGEAEAEAEAVAAN